MITVTVSINGHPIITRSARNTTIQNKKNETQYVIDDSRILWHDREAGAAKLAIEMLKGVKTV